MARGMEREKEGGRGERGEGRPMIWLGDLHVVSFLFLAFSFYFVISFSFSSLSLFFYF